MLGRWLRRPDASCGGRLRLHGCSFSSSSQPPAVLAYADGASRGNPGHSGCGALLLDPVSGRVLASRTAYLGDQGTNNSAEYNGLLLALKIAQSLDVQHLHVHMDSQLVVRQMQGVYRVKAANLRGVYLECKRLSASLGSVTFSYVPREDNAAADRLANEAIDAQLKLSPRHPAEIKEK